MKHQSTERACGGLTSPAPLEEELPSFLTLEQVANLTGLSAQNLRSLAGDDGSLCRLVRPGRKWLMGREDYRRWVESWETATDAAADADTDADTALDEGAASDHF